jgi:hypothetical protein
MDLILATFKLTEFIGINISALETWFNYILRYFLALDDRIIAHSGRKDELRPCII